MRTWRGRQRAAVVAVGAALALVLSLLVFGGAIARLAMVTGLHAAGYDLTYRQLDVGRTALHATDLAVRSRSGEPIATIARLDIGYSLRDLLPGSAHAYGLTSFDIERPHVTLIRHKDGSWNIPLQRHSNRQSSAPHFAFDGRLRDGSIDIVDAAQGVTSARHLSARDLIADLHVDTAARTRYTAHGVYEEEGQAFPIDGRGDIDTAAGIADQHWIVPHLPIARLVDFALNSPSMHLAGGRLDSIDARIVGLRDRTGVLAMHPSITAQVNEARLAIGGIPKPLRNLHGAIGVYGDGLVLHTLHATLNDEPIALGGAIYNLIAPKLDLVISGHGHLERLRHVLAQTTSLPLSGAAHLEMLVEGSASKPLMFVGLDMPHVRYRAVPFENVRGTIAFDGQEADVARFEARYAGMHVQARGRLALHARTDALHVVASLDAPANTIPYARAVVPGMPLHATIVANGNSLAAADTRGALYGSAARRSVRGTFDIASTGVGTLGPLRIRDPHESLYAIAAIDHPHDRATAFADAAHVAFDTRASGGPPGLNVPPILPMTGTLDGRIIATLHHAQVAPAGFATVSDLTTPYGTVARTSVRFATDARSGTNVALDARGIGKLGALASAVFAYRDGTVTVRDAAAYADATFAHATGAVADIGRSTQRYDLGANVHSADITSLAMIAVPARANLIEGSADADLHVQGSGRDPTIRGSVDAREGAIDGLAFSNLHALLGGSSSRLFVRDGRVDVGSTVLGFAGDGGAAGGAFDVRAPHADLADFNDFFDAGDMLAGRGTIAASASLGTHGLEATHGQLALANARVRSFALGTTTAQWSGVASRIAGNLAIDGQHGHASASGTIATSGAMDVLARARKVDLAAWLPMAGVAAPVTGLADADLRARGTYPSIDAALRARVKGGSLARVPIRAMDAAATLHDGHGRLSSLAVDIPNAHITGSGDFGIRPTDALALSFDAATPSLRALAGTLGAGTIDGDGAVTTHAQIRGNMRAPRIDDRVALSRGRYGRFEIPRALATVHVDPRTIDLRSAEVDLVRGRILANARVPVTLVPFAIDPRTRAISARLVADDVEARTFAALLPSDTRASGRLDGTVTVAGTLDAPRLGGGLTLADGSYSGPAERVPIEHAHAQLAFRGTTVQLGNAHADAGGGTIDLAGTAAMPSARTLSAMTYDLRATARHTYLDLPAYGKGRFDADIHLQRAPHARPELGGTLAMREARIPVSALYNPNASNAPAAAPPDIALSLTVLADRDVRVVSPNVDVGATGYVDVGGTLASPALDGSFTSTGGTVSFYRTLRVERGTVVFSPDNGVTPDVDAVASTTIADPATDIILHVTGPATGMTLDLASSPDYDREHILALLVNGGGGATKQSAITQLASGEINGVFTRNVLEPFSSQLGGGLGLENLQITSDLQSGLGVNAVKGIGKNLNAVYADTFGIPRRQSISLQTRRASNLQYAFTMFNTQGATLAGAQQPVLVNAMSIGNAATLPSDTGGNGFNFELKRMYP